MGLLSTSSVEFGSRLSATCTVLLLLYLLRIRYSKGLNKFPGPFLASFTDLWKIWYVYTTPERDLYVNVHRKYGDIVRIGPKQLSFADPRAINEIYGTGGGNQKVSAAIQATESKGLRTELEPILTSFTVRYLRCYSVPCQRPDLPGLILWYRCQMA